VAATQVDDKVSLNQMRKGRVGIVLAVLLGVPACALVAGVSEPTFRDALSDAETPDANPVDAIAQVDAADAFPAVDAGPAFCTFHIGAHFCADFENPLALYGDIIGVGGGTNSRDDSTGFQSRASLKFSSIGATFPATSGSQRVIPLGEAFLSKLTMEGVFRTNEVFPAAEQTTLMRIDLSDGTTNNQSQTTIFRDGSDLYIKLHATRNKIQEEEDVLLPNVMVGSWMSLRIVTDISGRRVQVYVNDALFLDRLYLFPGQLGISASYGQTSFDFTGSVPPRTLHWDNVLVETVN
jgi:hypothetical protein